MPSIGRQLCGNPLLMIFEIVHCVGTSSVELFDDVIATPPDMSALLIVSMRGSVTTPAWIG